jgi:hypothetical protein
MTKPLCIIDRFEGEKPQWAVIEYDGKLTFNIPRELLPDNAADGDVLEFDIKVNAEVTKSRREAAEALLKNLFRSE